MRWLLAALLLSTWGTCNAQEPLSFKGLMLGAPREKVFVALPPPVSPSCGDSCFFSVTACRGSEDCRKQFSYGGVPIQSMLVRFREDKLVSVYLVYASDSFGTLSAAMVERFGKPDMDRTSPVQNRMGASFDNRSMTWIHGDAMLWIRQRASQVDRGSVTFTSKQYLEDADRERKDEAKARAKDL